MLNYPQTLRKTAMTDLLCKDCKHSFRQWSDWWLPPSIALRCRLKLVEAKTTVDPVTGPKHEDAYWERCSTMRQTWTSKPDNCGERGQFWQPKHKQGLFKLIAKKEHG